MKSYRWLAITVGLALLLGVSARAQSTSCWVIVNGPGAGTELLAVNGTVVDVLLGHQGFIALGHFSDCECTLQDGHYHGLLFGVDDPDPDGCGWGCVVRIPCDENEALSSLQNSISNNVTNPALAAKLNGILDVAHGAVTNACGSLVRGALDAFGEELLAGFLGGQFNDTQLDGLLKDFANFVQAALDAAEMPPPVIEPPKPCKVELKLRKGSGAAAQFKDAGKKKTVDPGEVFSVDAVGCPGAGPYKWSYQFKGLSAGDVPSGAGVAFGGQRFSVLSEKPTSVKITVEFMCPDGKTVKDKITVAIQ